MPISESSAKLDSEAQAPKPKPTRRWRVLLPGGTLLAGMLALGIWGYWTQQNSDLFGLSDSSEWLGEIWEAKSQAWKPLTKGETERLLHQFSRAHEFHPFPNFSCGTACVNYGSPRYFVQLTTPNRTPLVFGVWASGRLADVWQGRIYGPGRRWIQFGGDPDEIASVLESVHERVQSGR
ncbi:MAG: hypothetical protein FD180_1531 [Planctomycetota bacterium]|nr:MAG: hypothetical protein FD180_1531 [Planctomycetota bacterium]